MEITFPVLVLEKDSADILKFESVAEMQHYLERIDVENNEYAAWGADGHSLSLLVQEPIWLKVVRAPEVGAPDLSDSLKRFARARQVSLTASEQKLAPMALFEAIATKAGSGSKIARGFRSRR